MTRVYIAGASSELPRVRAIQRRVREFCGEISFDWTVNREREFARWPTDADMPRDLQREIASHCLRGIRSADVFWLLSSREKSEGRVWEHCAAHHVQLARPDYHVIVSGEISTCFVALTNDIEAFDFDDGALEYVRGLIERRGAK